MSGTGAPPPPPRPSGAQQQIPPWLEEQVMKFQKTQQELQSISMQKQYIESEKANTARTLEELKKAKDDETVFKFAGSVLIRSTKQDLVSDLEERQELANTRATVTAKQEARLMQSLKEQETKITEMMKRGAPGAAASSAPPPPPPPSSPQL